MIKGHKRKSLKAKRYVHSLREGKKEVFAIARHAVGGGGS